MLVIPGVSTTLSIPLLLSLDGSSFRKPIVVEVPAAVNVWVNCCQTNSVGLTVELVSVKVTVPLIVMLAVLVVP